MNMEHVSGTFACSGGPKLMSSRLSLPRHSFIINKISLFTSNLRGEKQKAAQMPAIVQSLFFINFFATLGFHHKNSLCKH
jgi:hypothetical protein